MKTKLKNWFKSIVDFLKQNAQMVFVYIVGIILGVIFEKTNLKYCTKFTYHGEDVNIKDGDFIAYDTKRKTWDLFHNNKD